MGNWVAVGDSYQAGCPPCIRLPASTQMCARSPCRNEKTEFSAAGKRACRVEWVGWRSRTTTEKSSSSQQSCSRSRLCPQIQSPKKNTGRPCTPRTARHRGPKPPEAVGGTESGGLWLQPGERLQARQWRKKPEERVSLKVGDTNSGMMIASGSRPWPLGLAETGFAGRQVRF